MGIEIRLKIVATTSTSNLRIIQLKYSLFEAGTRVPFITYWKSHIEPKKSDALISQLDILASLAKLTGYDIDLTDSQELLDVLMGNLDEAREELVLEASSRTALRKGNWLMIPPYSGPAIESQVNIELGNSNEFLLYDLNNDLAQQENLAKKNPDQLARMIEKYEAIVGEVNSNVEALELK